MNFLDNVDKRLATILLIVFVQIVGASLVLPILPLYAQREFAMSPQTITLLVSSFFAAQFVAGPWLGRLSDKYGRVPVLIASQIGTAVSFLMLAVAPNVATLYAARIVDGITGGNIIVAQAYVTDITPREERTEALGYIFAAFGLGFIFGPALGGILSAAFGARLPFVLAAIAAAVTVLITWRVLDETLSPEQREANQRFRRSSLSPGEIWNNTPLLLILIITFVGQFAFGLLQSTFALYGEAVIFAGYSVSMTNLGIGLLLAVVGLSQFLTQTVLLRRLVKRFGDVWLVVGGTITRTLGFLVYAALATPWFGALGSVLFAVGMGTMMPPLQSLATGTVDDELRGGVLGVYQSAQSLATIVSTASAGVLFAVVAALPYWIGAALSLLSLVPVYFFVRQRRMPALEVPILGD